MAQRNPTPHPRPLAAKAHALPAAPAARLTVTRAEIEALARIGTYSVDLATGRWVSSRRLDAIVGIERSFPRTRAGGRSLVHPDDRDALEAYLADEVLARGEPFDRLYRIVRADDGEERRVHARGILRFDPSGHPVRLVGTLADVTAERAERDDLGAAGQRQRAILEGTAEAILVADARTFRYRWVNPAACALFGYTRHELLARRVQDLHPAAALPRILAAFTSVVDGTLTEGLAVPCLRKDGTLLYADIRASTTSVDGTSLNIAFFTDATARMAAEAERDRLAAAVEQTSDAVIITDQKGAIEYVNPAFETMSGYRRAEALGRNPRILKSGRQSEAFYRALWNRLSQGANWSGRFFNRRSDGTLYQVEATISPLRDGRGELSGYIGLQRDVTALQAARSSLASEFRERSQVAAALARLQPGPSVAETAAEICVALAGLPGLDSATIINFRDPQNAMAVGVVAPQGFPLVPGAPLPEGRTAYLYERAELGPWAEAFHARRADGRYGRAMAATGMRAFAYAPIRNGEGLLGLVAAGTRDPAYARHLVDHLPAVSEFAATASALLARDLEGDHRLTRLHAQVAGVITARAYTIVFQPIVDLGGGEAVGYEALTRFHDGARPDHRFADAWTADLGAELELATLEAAIGAARHLPAGRWLDLNVSPRLLVEPQRLGPTLARADRPLVLEITEHDTIDDYRALRAALGSLGDSVRVAVDDAGAGIANLAHIVELRPDFVKLDIGLVRGVDTDLGRQAMVTAMRHYARSAGCRLIGEGVEREAEARTLANLGVGFGQGYFFGRPEAVVNENQGGA